jgi:hypothetical protein
MSNDTGSDDVVSVNGRPDELLRDLRDRGWEIAQMEAGESYDSFFAAAARTLPADPPMGPFPNWDGFADSLSGGIIGRGQAPLALLWRDARRMRDADPQLFATAIDVFRQVLRVLNDERRAGRSSARLRLYLFGLGDVPGSSDPVAVSMSP